MKYSGQDCEFEYPNNWSLKERLSQNDKLRIVDIDPTEEAFIMTIVNDAVLDLDKMLAISVEEQQKRYPTLGQSTPFGRWGSITVKGKTLRGIINRTETIMSIFTYQSNQKSYTTTICYPKSEEELIRIGLLQFEKSYRMKP